MVDDKLLLGKPVVEALFSETRALVEKLKSEKGVTPCLATILVGEDPASEMYVNMKGKRCRSVGAEARKIILPSNITTKELIEAIEDLNQDSTVHGILLQHPVPEQIDERAAFETIAVEKDVDGVTAKSFGRFSFKMPAWGCATPLGIMHLLNHYKINLKGLHCVVVGRSTILGQPMSMMLMNADATVTICHSKTRDLPEHVKRADLIVAAVGRPKFIQGDWVKEGAIVIDAGYNEGNFGDVDYESVYPKASKITPVPGGVGPCTIATLINQGIRSAAEVNGISLQSACAS